MARVAGRAALTMMDTDGSWVVEAENLGKRFGRLVAVQSIDIRIAQGEIFGLLGSDGAGKTTTLQMLAAILDPSFGRATVLGHDTVRAAARVTSTIGYMSQRFSLYGRLSVEENLAFFAKLHRVPEALARERTARLLAFARLDAHREQVARALSGGMQKKLALCCALIHSPPVLILDEPTTGVDPVSRREFWGLLYRALTEAATTIVVSTPYMDEAERCTRVALLHAGRMVACDHPGRLRDGMPGVMLEIEAKPARAAHAALAAALPSSRPYLFGDRLHIHVEDEDRTGSRVTETLAAQGIAVNAVRTVRPSLEDVFVVRLGKDVEAAAAPLLEGTSSVIGAFAVETDGLTMRFGTFTAVDNLSISVRRGEIFGFLGPNGSGKTTTIKMLCGLLRPTAGSASVAGVKLVGESLALRSRIGYMSQRFSLYEDLTVRENLELFAGLYRVPRPQFTERCAWALALANLERQHHLRISSLSGAIKQRLALACAVLHNPEVLFLDEPTAGVDPLSRRRFWDLIYGMADRGVTVFVTTHYMDEAEHCHTLGLLYNGRLIALGSPESLRAHMRAGEMLEVECDAPIQAVRVLADQDALQASLFGDRLHLLVDNADTAGAVIAERLRRAGHRIRRIEQVPLSIEDVVITFIDMEQSRLTAA